MILIGFAQAQDHFAVKDAWARETPPGVSNGAVYFNIYNTGIADQLIEVSTDVAERAEMHTHINQDGVMQMRRVEAIDVPAGGQATLKPHGNHVMLIGLKRPLKVGETVQLRLQFKTGASLEINVPVARDPP